MPASFELDSRLHPTLAAALSPVLRDYDRRIAMAKENALLAFAYWAEALGDRRVENDVCAGSQLTDLRDRARAAVERVTGKPFHNPLYK